MTISEKVAYIQGLFDGLKLDTAKSGEVRILSEVLDVRREVRRQLEGMDAAMDQFDEEEEDFFEIPCPTCGEDLVVDDEALAAGVVDCPACGGKFALSFEDGEDEGPDDE